jgi:hypothetical protein
MMMRSAWRRFSGQRAGFLLDLAGRQALNILQIDLHAKLIQHRGLQAVEIVIILADGFGAELIDVAADYTAHDFGNALLLNMTVEQLAAHAVYRLPLLVHHIVVFEDVLARQEMLGFDRLLGRGDARSDELRFDRHILFHAEPQHQILHAVAAENTQQIVLQREIEARTAGIALASGASAQLIINAPGFVTFGAQDVQTAGG